ncbi:MAG: MXAN_6640 family putative metalloprotease [candidate division KSB1 bacterium]|nr:MXAN_6640 family putative metalloprotease [candidate division KSB1 bacterium]
MKMAKKTYSFLFIFFVVFFMIRSVSSNQRKEQRNPINSAEFSSSTKQHQRLEKRKHTKCGTFFVHELLNSPSLSKNNFENIVSHVMSRPTMQSFYDTPEGHFRIHYNTETRPIVYQHDVDVSPKDSHPDFVNRTGAYFEKSYAFIIDSLGYLTPPSDGGRGGNDRYDVYLSLADTLGLTSPDSRSDQYDGYDSYTSHIQLNAAFDENQTPDKLAKVTAAHEFFHAVQFAYGLDYFADINSVWFTEASAVWIEDLIYDDVNDYYGYLPTFFNSPWKSLQTWDNNAHAYAACIWPHFLHQKYDIDIIKEIWENANYYNSIYNVTRDLLANRQVTLDDAFQEFTRWNYFTGYRYSTNLPHYDEARYYPQVSIQALHTELPVINQAPPVNERPDHLAANYIRAYNNSTESKRALFNLNSRYDWELQGLCSINGIYTLLQPVYVSNSEAFIDIPAECDQFILIPSVTSKTGEAIDYTYEILKHNTATGNLSLNSIDVIDANNSRVEPGETATLSFSLQNSGPVINDLTLVLKSAQSDIAITPQDITTAIESLSATQLDFEIKAPEYFMPQKTDFTLTARTPTDSVSFDFTLAVGFAPILFADKGLSNPERDVYFSILDSLGLFYDHISLPNDEPKLDIRTHLLCIVEKDTLSAEFQEKVLNQLSSLDICLITNQISDSMMNRSFFQEAFDIHWGAAMNAKGITGISGNHISESGNGMFVSVLNNADVLVPSSRSKSVFYYDLSDKSAAVTLDANSKRVMFGFPVHELDEKPMYISPYILISRVFEWFETDSRVSKVNRPDQRVLQPCYPNPFNSSTQIKVDTENALSNCSINVYNIRGEHVKTIFQGNLAPGVHSITWEGINSSNQWVGNGNYFIRLSSDNVKETRKIIVLK